MIVEEVVDDKLIVTLTAGNVTCKCIYKKAQNIFYIHIIINLE